MNEEREQQIVQIISKFPDGVGIDDIHAGLETGVTTRTLQRWLKKLADVGLIEISGAARATMYSFVQKDIRTAAEKPEKHSESLIPLSEGGKKALAMVTAPIQKRVPVGYQQDFLKSYRPNIDSYLTVKERKHLAEIGDTQIEQPAGTYAQQILNRLLIDLSWNSSRLEGNTYSLLDTQRLIEFGEADSEKSGKEAQMILNHKDAIEFIVQITDEIGYNRYTLLNIHAMLANNLLPDPEAAGRLRSMAVGITGSTFTPLAIPQLVEEYFDLILEKVEQIEDPFEQSFFLMVHLPYLQPFDDVNKRVSRLAANIPLIKKNLSPLSFIDVPEDIYFQGMMSIYEQNDISLLKDVFIWSYERSAAQYKVIRQSLGEPDAFKLKYRIPIRQLITSIILKAESNKNMLDHINAAAEAIPEQDRGQFISSVENEITSLHEGNFARYRVSPSEFARFKNSGK
ncbi:MAG: Fic family protein [Chryseobacterium sp.]|uniref:Fic family protein n=1 Tax=Pedobacter anseongensis TaxID=3133439 RepID=UPI00120FDC94|nr:MAG: Fic family protein [Chryseobacterium sp.]